MRATRKRRGPAAMPLRVLLANPRGFCAGVDRAVMTVERALDAWGPPVYVRRQVVHNRRVVEDLEARGAIFVESELDVPANSRLVLAAHGVPPEVYANAAERNLLTIDTTCPLVRKVHAEVRSFATRGCTVVVVGHAGHDEVVGTAAQAPHAVVVVGTAEQASAVELPEGSELAFVTQTTLSVDDTAHIIAILRALPADRRAADSRHLLRDDEPAEGGEAAPGTRRRRCRRRFARELQLEPPRRDGARRRRPGLAGRGRARARRAHVPRLRRRRRDVGCFDPGGFRHGDLRLVS